MIRTYLGTATVQNKQMQVWEFSRPGADATSYFYLKHKSRWITPFECRVKGYHLSHSDLLKFIYHKHLPKLITGDNSFLKLLPKDNQIGAYYHIPIIL